MLLLFRGSQVRGLERSSNKQSSNAVNGLVRVFDSTWRDEGRPQEEVMLQLRFEDCVGFIWEERVGMIFQAGGVTCPPALRWERAVHVYVTAVVSQRQPACVVDGGRAWNWEGGHGGDLDQPHESLSFKCSGWRIMDRLYKEKQIR